MKKLLILFALFLMVLSGYSQDTISILKGIKPKMRSAGQDTLVSFIAHNTNTGGNAGFVAIAGNDTLILRIDSAGVFRIEKLQSTVISSDFIPDSTAKYTLGTSAVRWKRLYIGGTNGVLSIDIKADADDVTGLKVNSILNQDVDNFVGIHSKITGLPAGGTTDYDSYAYKATLAGNINDVAHNYTAFWISPFNNNGGVSSATAFSIESGFEELIAAESGNIIFSDYDVKIYSERYSAGIGNSITIAAGDGSGVGNAGGDLILYGGTEDISGGDGNVILAYDGVGIRGSVGIGISNPSEVLEVDGNVRGDTAKFLAYVGHSDFTIGSSTSDVTFDSDTIFLKSSATKIYKDGSNELTFTDGVSGTKTLSQLSAASGTMIGEITMYFGDIAIFPTATHALCDGANGTPDLRGRFIRGWSDAVGQEFSGSSARRNNTQVDATAMPTSAFTNSTDDVIPNSEETPYGTLDAWDAVTTGNTHTGTGAFLVKYLTGNWTDGSHTHAISGGDAETRPMNYALAFIMRIAN